MTKGYNLNFQIKHLCPLGQTRQRNSLWGQLLGLDEVMAWDKDKWQGMG